MRGRCRKMKKKYKLYAKVYAKKENTHTQIKMLRIKADNKDAIRMVGPHTCTPRRCPAHHGQALPKQQHKKQPGCRYKQRQAQNFLPFSVIISWW